MSATHQARGAGVRRPPRREHVPPYRPPIPAPGFRLSPPDEGRAAPAPQSPPGRKVRVEVVITESDRVERFVAQYLSGPTDGPDAGCRIVRLRRADDGAECRVLEAWEGPVCDCADFKAPAGCRHTEALIASRLIDDLGPLAEREVGHG